MFLHQNLIISVDTKAEQHERKGEVRHKTAGKHMSNCEGCSSKGNCSRKGCCSKIFPKHGKIKNIIGIMSGKGGVGKSTVTSIIASKLRNTGYSVGILDADITGPSIPRIFGINDKRAEIIEEGSSKNVKFIPVDTSTGIRTMSLNFLTEEEEQPVIWRGPVINGVLNQMFTDTVWGDLDYLLIDMPPGTGDVALTIMQSFNVDGMVMVALPQDMVTVIVKKAVIMAEKLKVKVIGIVENMSYVVCPDCGKKVSLYSDKASDEFIQELGAPLLMELPMDSKLIESMNRGEIEKYINDNWDYNTLIKNLIENK